MEITQIENKLSALILAQGYTPVIMSEEGARSKTYHSPTALISLPKVLYIEGRGEGVICHSIEIIFIDNCSGYTTELKDSTIERIHADALEILTSLSLDKQILELTDITLRGRITASMHDGGIEHICKAKLVTNF